MNETDRKILEELKKDSRQTNKLIAGRLGISEGTVRNRIKKLVKNGVIRRFTVDLSTSRGFMAYVLIETDPHKPTREIVLEILQVKDIVRIHESAGRWDVIVFVDTESAADFNSIIESIRSIRGVLNTETLTVLGTN